MGRRRAAVAALVTAVLVIGAGVAVANRNDAPPAPQPLGAFDLPDLRTSVRHSNSSILGKPAVITVFDSQCVPCRVELPMMDEVAAQTAGRVQFMGVDHLERRRDALAFVDQLDLDFPIAHELTGDLSISWQIAGLPTTLFVDSRGQEVGRVTGSISRDDLLHRIERLE